MVWKGKSKPKHLVKNHRRLQITPVPQKLVQELVSSQAINCVKAHQLSMQFGFSAGISFLQASVARECVSKYAVDKGDHIYLIAADVESAFSRTERICQLGFQGEFGKLFLFSVSFFATSQRTWWRAASLARGRSSRPRRRTRSSRRHWQSLRRNQPKRQQQLQLTRLENLHQKEKLQSQAFVGINLAPGD